MKERLLDFLICPSCIPIEIPLVPEIHEKDGDDILYGTLRCGMCRAEYSVHDGVAFLAPGRFDRSAQPESCYEIPALVASYLWSHYSTLFDQENANTAYDEWAALMDKQSGRALDAGCAVGRFTFEMSRLCDFVVGVDLSQAFVETARRLMRHRTLDIAIPEEGMLLQQETIRLPDEWRSDKVEFIVADIQALPFHSGIFSTVTSLNLVDKVPLPMAHLREMNRVAAEKKAGFLFSDPFSWSHDVARPEDWLGGTPDGPFAGRGPENVEALLSGKRGGLAPAWKIGKKGGVWWRLRNHVNHFELIRSCYIKAGR